MMDFSNAKNIVIPEGEVSVIARGEDVLWRKQIYKRELLYLESTKTQWIDTGVVLTSTMDYEFTGSVSDNTVTGWIAGAPTWIGIHKKAGTVAITQASTGNTYNAVEVNEVFKIGLFGNKAYFNGIETSTLKRNDTHQNYTLFLFAYHHTNDTGSINSACRMYSFRIWDGGDLVRDFIPVLDWNDRPCMYDSVTNELFYNLGKQEFLYG